MDEFSIVNFREFKRLHKKEVAKNNTDKTKYEIDVILEEMYISYINKELGVNVSTLKDALKERRHVYDKMYYKDNKDKIIEYKHTYYKDNKERIAERSSIYAKAHRDIQNRSQRKYAAAHREYLRERNKKYYHANKDRLNAAKREDYRRKKEEKLKSETKD